MRLARQGVNISLHHSNPVPPVYWEVSLSPLSFILQVIVIAVLHATCLFIDASFPSLHDHTLSVTFSFLYLSVPMCVLVCVLVMEIFVVKL